MISVCGVIVRLEVDEYVIIIYWIFKIRRTWKDDDSPPPHWADLGISVIPDDNGAGLS
jgi:hypothetical protein